MSARSRKRRRSQAFPEPDEDEETKMENGGQDRLDKEREVWDAFKDEFVEVFELSSYLLRKFNLISQLDRQDAENAASLRENLMNYIDYRRTLCLHSLAVESVALEGDGDVQQQNAHPNAQHKHRYSREMLAMIVKLSEASIRDREEKVNVTRAACDSVERSIRLIDQRIQEQEQAISLGARPGTRLAPILLPEIRVPRWSKPARVSLSPDLDDVPGETQKVLPQPGGRRKSRKGRKKETAEAVEPPPRPKPPVIPNPDPNEQRYCYCDQVSFGEMIACDDPRCEREWFHISCTNLATTPEGRKKWYCDDCVVRRRKR